jgi:3-oxoisoapionate kinase
VKRSSNLLLAFYGDDFTGSTDALESLTRAGAKTILFIEPPSAKQLAKYPGLDAIGIAGLTRSMAPEQMNQTLSEAFEQLKQLKPRHVHYKVCSTFDSSPSVGSIGKAIDTGMKVFRNTITPLLVAAPGLGRYCLFGNLFARMGTKEGIVYRLDRHPSMSKHPATPAEESDLRLHLSKQTRKKTGLIDILKLAASKKEISLAVDQCIQDGNEIVLFDALYEEQLLKIGGHINEFAENSEKTLFSAGSSGIETALGQYWNETGLLKSVTKWPPIGKADPLLVISGSCSPVTAAQVKKAKKEGFEELILDPSAIADKNETGLWQVIRRALVLMQHGRHVIIHTNNTANKKVVAVKASRLGAALGFIAKNIAKDFSLRRLVIVGGDTSSYAARALGIEAVEMIASLVPGAPVCRAIAPGSPIDGVQVNFKGGQVGGEDYFEILAEGRA